MGKYMRAFFFIDLCCLRKIMPCTINLPVNFLIHSYWQMNNILLCRCTMFSSLIDQLMSTQNGSILWRFGIKQQWTQATISTLGHRVFEYFPKIGITGSCGRPTFSLWEKLTFTSIVVAAFCTLISNVSVFPFHINFERSKINSLMLFKSLGKQEQTTSKQ